MDRTPTRARTRCPRCATPLAVPPPATCPSCALAVGSDAGRRLLDVEVRLAVLRDERAALITRLIADERGRDAATPATPEPPPPHRRLASALAAWLSDTGPQSLLAAGGVLLLVVAATVFTAVTWDDLPALARGGVLLAAAAGSGVLTGALMRRGLPRTAESTATLAVALLAVLARGLWDAGLLGGPDQASLVAAAVAAVLALVGHGLARATGTRAPLVLASWLGPVAPIAAAIWFAEHRPPAPSVDLGDLTLLAAVVGAAVLAVAYAEWQLATVPRWRAVTQVAGVASWAAAAVGTVVALGALVDEPVLRPTLLAGTVVLGAAVVGTALQVRVLRRRSRWWDLIGVTGAWFAATTLALAVQDSRDPWRPLLTLAPSALGVLALRSLDGRALRRAAVVGMAPALLAAGALIADVVGIVWEVVVVHLSTPWAIDRATLGASPGVEPLLAALLAVPVLVAVGATVDRRAAVGVAVVLGGLTLTAVGVEVWPTAGGAVVALAVVVAAAQALGRGWMTGVGPVVLAGSLVAVAVGLSGPVVTVAVLTAAAVAAWPAVRHDRLVAATVAADLLALAVAVTAWVTDGSGPVAVVLAVAAGAAVAVAAAVRARPDAAEPVEAVALVGGLLAVLLTGHAGEAAWPAWTFAVEAVACAGISLWRDDRRALRWVATLLASASSSTLLADAGVELVEAHTMPPALVVLGLSAAALRAGRITSSWPGLGTGAGLLVGPSLAQLADHPTDLPRLAVTLVLGVLLAAAGRTWGLQAPLVVGVGALTLAALTQHEVVTDVVPRWVLLAAGGSLLLWLSISYERQRARVSAARQHLAAMR